MYDVFKLTVLVLLGAQAIFLSNVVVADLLPEVMEHQAGLGNLATLVVLTIPGVMVIALPLAVVVGSYLVVMNRRAFGEFASFAGMGFSSNGLLKLMAAIGAGAIVVSHLTSGYAEPMARYALAKTLFNIENDAVREGRIAAGEFNAIGDYVVFAEAGRFNATANGLFIHERIDEDSTRFITADRSWRIPGEDRPGLELILGDVAVYQFEADERADQSIPICEGCFPETAEVMLSDQMYVQFREPAASSLRTRDARVADWTNLELLMAGTSQAGASATLSERLLRDLLCLVAPFVALLAAALTTTRTYLFALPLAGGVVLAAQFLGTFAAQSFVGVGVTTVLIVVLALAALAGCALSAIITRRQSGLIQPLEIRL